MTDEQKSPIDENTCLSDLKLVKKNQGKENPLKDDLCNKLNKLDVGNFKYFIPLFDQIEKVIEEFENNTNKSVKK